MIKDIQGLLARVKGEIKENVDIAVIGLSGGADSTLVAILCAEALGKENVFGVSMPYDKKDFLEHNRKSSDIAKLLGIHSIVCEIYDIADAAIKLLGVYCKGVTKNTKGNVKSRTRMIVLYGLANELGEKNKDKKVRVIGTGNLSEDFIGYDTKGGDALTDIFPIGTLFKSEVYQLLDYYKDKGVITEDFIARVPTAGLWEGQTDEGELGHSYNSMESSIKILRQYPLGHLEAIYKKNYVEEGKRGVAEFVLGRHLVNRHKHEAPQVIDLRDHC